jgi:cytochrome oxidase Cu insertion factor (SCO1/SenC/PrrC family)
VTDAPPGSTHAGSPPAGDAPAGGGSVGSIDRPAALAEGAPGLPGNFIFWVLGAIAVLSVVGLVGERVFSAVGLNPTPASTTTTTVPPAAAPGAATLPAGTRSLAAPLDAFMGLTTPSVHRAPGFTLTGLSGDPVMVPTPSRTVVLTFFDARCDDICPVLASEIEQADADLGARASAVEFVTVNTDPSALASSAAAPVLATGLGALGNWQMVTGPLASLDAVWKHYGVSISVDTSTGREAHNDTMDFIDPRGEIRARAVPFANESSSGVFSLPAPSIARWAHGIATTAGRVASQ